MFGTEFLILAFVYVAVPILVLATLYWVIRLAVRDGILAARARSSEQQL